VKGGDGPDLIVGSSVANQIDGGGGDDTLDGGGGADLLRGGDGFDVADYSSRTVDLRVSLDGTADDGAPGENDNVDSDVEDIWGGSGDDRLAGNDLDNAIDGGLGADEIVGGDGVDSVDYSLRTANLARRAGE
jgi:Ca2+-binding RTX toxin-like protein